MPLVSRHQQQGRRLVTAGFSFLELIVGMALGLLLMTGMVTMVTQVLASQTRTLQLAQAQEEANMALAFMVQELRRAGYWAHAAQRSSEPTPFELPSKGPFHCVLFSYDANGNGQHDGDSELFGFRLHQYQIQRRQRGANCEQSGWESMTHSAQLRVLALNFESLPRHHSKLPLLRIRMTISHPQQLQWLRELQMTVSVRNGELQVE